MTRRTSEGDRTEPCFMLLSRYVVGFRKPSNLHLDLTLVYSHRTSFYQLLKLPINPSHCLADEIGQEISLSQMPFDDYKNT